MDRLAEYRQLIATTKYDIKLMKTDEFNRVWQHHYDSYDNFMKQLYCTSFKYTKKIDTIQCKVKLNYSTRNTNTIRIEIKTYPNEYEIIHVYINGILEYEQEKRMTRQGIYEVDKYFNNYGQWDLNLIQVNNLVRQVLYIIESNELMKG